MEYIKKYGKDVAYIVAIGVLAVNAWQQRKLIRNDGKIVMQTAVTACNNKKEMLQLSEHISRHHPDVKQIYDDQYKQQLRVVCAKLAAIAAEEERE